MTYYCVPGLKNREDIDYYKCYLDLRPEIIIGEVASFYGVSEYQLICPPRSTQKYVFPKQVAVYLLCTETCLTNPRISNMMGGMDYSGIRLARKKIQGLISVDISVAAQIKILLTKIK